ncbi:MULTISPECIES: YCF48-related protein [Cysteiniphilum]|uniref:DUF6242 domain-containing protein n=1 Tax=Cysteiniphilum litorale TaxID=2056700 RepID=A0A8J3E8W0_9GAMM|nr:MULTISPECIES: YCF48-related protein [Cysteiniphilum]GGF96569.1 hypothetical protein GCM10010995_12240 [Cysteiniphilum litorale]
MKITKLIPVIVSSMLLFGCNSDDSDSNHKNTATTTASLVPSQTQANIETSHSLQITVTNAGNKQADDFAVELQADDGVSIDKTASNIPSQLAPGASAVIVLTASNSAVVGSKATLTIRSSDSINQLSIPVDVIAEPPEVVKLALSTGSSVLGSGGMKHYVLTNNSAQDVPELTGADKGVSGLSLAAYQSGTSIAATGVSIINNTCSGVILKPSENCTFDVKAADTASNQAIDVKVTVNGQTEVSKSLQILRPVLSINPEDALSGFKSQMTKTQSQLLSLDSQHITIVPGMKKTIQITNSSVVPATDVQFSIPALSGVSQDPASTCINGMTLNGGDSCTIIVDGSLENYPSGSGDLQISANNADQVNQLMLGSSSSSQLQMSDSYRLVINGGKSMDIPLKARNNSSLSLDHLAMSILPNDGSLVASTNNNCGTTLLGQGYCTNNYTYTAPNATTHEQKLYSLVYGNTQNNGNNSTGTLLGVDVYPTGGFIPSNALTNLIPGASGNVVVENGVMYVATLGLSISKDNGQTWQTVSSPEIADPSSVSNVAVSGDNIYVSTYAGLSLSHDGGKTWKTKTTTDSLPSNSVAYVYASGDDVYLATNAGLAISTDKGATWTTKTTADGLTSNDVRMVTENNGEIYLTTRSPGGVSFSTDGGTTWTTKTVADGILNDNRSIYVDGNKIYVGGYQGYSVSTDNGSTWTSATLPQLQYAAVYGIYADGDDIFLASGNGISVSHDDGVNWTLENSSNNNLPGDFTSAISKIGNVLYAGTGYALAKSTDNGNSWQVVYSAPGVYADRVSFINKLNGTLYAGTISTGLYISKDDGVNWQNYNSKTGLSGDCVVGAFYDVATHTLYVVVGDWNGAKTINYTTDGGKTWVQEPKATFGNSIIRHGGVYVYNNKVFVPTWNGLVTSNDGGATWSAPVSAPFGGSQLYGITGEGDNIYLFGNHGLWVSTDGGTNWTKKYNPATYFGSIGGVFVSGQNILINTWNYGAGKPILLISSDGGNNWVSKTAVDLGMPAGSYIQGAVIANGTIYVATWGLGVIYSTDGGNTWLRKTTDDGLQANMIQAINADKNGDVFLGNVAGFSIMKADNEGILIPE